jgi:hypothetical protein
MMPLPPIPCYLLPPMPKYFPQQSILKHSQPMFLPQCERQSYGPIQKIDKIIFLYVLIFVFLGSLREDKRFCIEL